MTPYERITATSHIERFDFETANIPDAAGTAVLVGGGAGGSDYPMPKNGSIIGVGARLNGALIGGTVTFRPLLNTSAVTGAAGTALSSSAQQTFKELPVGKYPVAQGQYLGCDWTKSGTVNPTTLDAVISIWVLFDDFPQV